MNMAIAQRGQAASAAPSEWHDIFTTMSHISTRHNFSTLCLALSSSVLNLPVDRTMNYSSPFNSTICRSVTVHDSLCDVIQVHYFWSSAPGSQRSPLN